MHQTPISENDSDYDKCCLLSKIFFSLIIHLKKL